MPRIIIQEVIEITAPSIEPITLAEAKAQARIDTSTSAEDDLISDVYIPAARLYLENRTGTTVHQKTLEWMLSDFPSSGIPVRLRGATPLISITSVKYKVSDGTETTWAAANYIADTVSKTGRMVPAYGITYPQADYPNWPVRIRGVAGIATASPITEASPMVKLTIAELVSAAWCNRDAEELPERPVLETVKFSYGVEALLAALQREYAF